MNNILLKSFFVVGVLVLLSVITLPFALYFIYEEAVTVAKVQFNKQQGLIVGQTSIGIEKYLKILVHELENLSQEKSVKSLDIEAARDVLKKTFFYVSSFNVNDVAIIDSRGIVRLSLRASHLQGKDFSFREYFQQAKILKRPTPSYEFITFRGVEAGKRGIIIAMPIFSRGGEFDGVVVFTLKVDGLIRGIVSAYADSGDWKAWVMDRAGHILYHPNYQPGTLIGELPQLDPTFKAFVEIINKGEAHQSEYLSPEGERVLAASHPAAVGGQTWSIVMSSPVANVSGLFAHFTVHFAFGVGLVFLIIGGGVLSCVYLFSKWNSALQLEIAEHRATEEELRFSEERFRGLFNQAFDSIFLMEIGPEGPVIVDLNIAACQMHGYERDELLGRPIKFLDAPETAEQIEIRSRELLENRVLTFEGEHLRKDGTIFPVEVSAQVIRLGEKDFVLAFDRDITERKQAEEDLRKIHNELEMRVEARTADLSAANEQLQLEIQEREHVESVLRTIAEGVSGATGDAFLLSLVQYLAKTLEMDHALLGRLTDDRRGVVQAIAVCAHGEIVENFQYELAGTPCAEVAEQGICLYPSRVQQQFPEDSLLAELGVESYLGIRLFDSAGQPVGLMVVMDSSPIGNPELTTSMMQIFATRAAAELERKRQEEALLRVRNLESIGRLAAGIAHEINNPLTNASLNMQLLLKKFAASADADAVLGKLEAVERNIDRASVIAKELLLFSRPQDVKLVPIDLHVVIGRALELLTCDLDNIRIQQELSVVPEIQGDELKLEGLFINILNNAVEAMPQGGEIGIASSCEDQQVIVGISDTGVGIPDDILPKVFDPFFTTKEVGAGTGLGLSICYGIVRQHGGSMELSSNAGQGVCVTLKFPVQGED